MRVLIHRFNAGGVAALSWHSRMAPGKPSRFTADVLQDIAEAAVSSPVALTGLTRWSLSKLRGYLIEQKVVPSLSRQWLRGTCRRPTTWRAAG